MFEMSSQQLVAIKKDYTIIEAFIPEPEETEEERAERDSMRKRLFEMDPDKFIELNDLITEDYHETEEYIKSLREVAGLY